MTRLGRLQLSDQSRNHNRRVRGLRYGFPLLVLGLGLAWFAAVKIQRATSKLRFVASITDQISAVGEGYIDSYSVSADGVESIRKIRFDQMEGTGLRGSPLELGSVKFELFKDGVLTYKMESTNAKMDPRQGVLHTTSDLWVQGPDGFHVRGHDSTVDFITFETVMHGQVELFADGGVSATSTDGMLFVPSTGVFVLSGKSSAYLPRELPDLQ